MVLRLHASFLNNSASRWESLADPWAVRVEGIDHGSPIYRSDHQRYGALKPIASDCNLGNRLPIEPVCVEGVAHGSPMYLSDYRWYNPLASDCRLPSATLATYIRFLGFLMSAHTWLSFETVRNRINSIHIFTALINNGTKLCISFHPVLPRYSREHIKHAAMSLWSTKVFSKSWRLVCACQI